MPLFRNIRNSLSRGRSSSRDITPVRPTRPASYTGNSPVQRRDSSADSRTDSFFSRSDTFILDTHQSPDDQRSQNSSNNSLPENKSKKSKMFGKFSTFSKRKKPTDSAKDNNSPDHHPSEHATNTYYKWQSEGPSNMDYDAKSDPFNFLYEQPSSLMDIQGINRGINTEPIRSVSVGTHFDSMTVRRNKSRRDAVLRENMANESSQVLQERNPSQPKQQVTQGSQSEREDEKFRTITINSFRKSFRERLLNQKNDVPHNPAWFVEVEEPVVEPCPPPTAVKENRSDVLVFANENYKPLIRSPVRDHKSNSLRSPSRSSIKRNETFRVDRQLYAEQSASPESSPSIRIEIKNSITPNGPGRMVPVGVAKPMPSSSSSSSPNTSSYKLRMPDTIEFPASASISKTESLAKRNSELELKDWLKPVAGHSVIASVSPKIPGREGRYQTLVEIRSDSVLHEAKRASLPPLHSHRIEPLRIQLSSVSSRPSMTPLDYRNAKNTQNASSQTQPFTARYDSGSSSHNNMKPVTKTYFGDNAQRLHHSSFKPRSPKGGGGGGRCTPAESGNKTQIRAPLMDSKRSGSVNQHQRRPMTTTTTTTTTIPVSQRRSRSPIKIPWR